MVLERGSRDAFEGLTQTPHVAGHGVDGGEVEGAAAACPDVPKRVERRVHLSGQRPADRIEQRRFLHPAAGEGVHWKDVLHEGVRSLGLSPGGDVCLFLSMRSGLAHLVGQRDDGFVYPG